MAIVRWNPQRDLMQMREEMDRLFNQFLRRGEGEEATLAQGLWAPPVDIYETDDAFMLKAELPGFTKEDVSIEIHENRLIIRGERKRETEAKEDQYHRLERAYGRFERAFWLPTTVDAEQIQATFKDGVLELRLPKSPAAKPKQIPITEEGRATGNGSKRVATGAESPR
jgi:HSP20 family protein